MNGLDVLIGGALLLFAGIGALRGLLREVLSLSVWVLAVGGAWLLSGAFADWFAPADDVTLGQVIAFVVIFCVIFVAATVTAFLLRKLLFGSGSGAIDRAGGALLGVVRASVVIVILVLLAGLTSLPQKTWWRESALLAYFQPLAVTVRDWLPEGVARQFRYG